MQRPRRRRHERPRAGSDDLALEHELDLALEDVERIDVVTVAMRGDVERRIESDLVHGELRQLGFDSDDAVTAIEPLAFTWAADHSRHDGKSDNFVVPSESLRCRAVRLVLDWDGTVTVRDSLVQVIERFGDPELLRELEPRVGVDLTLHEEIALEFAEITASLGEVVAWVLEHVEVRPGLRELAALEPLVVSAGFRDLIEPVLEREGVRLEVRANQIDERPDGWRVRFNDKATCATCG